MNIGNVLDDMGNPEEALVELKKGLDVLVSVRPRAPDLADSKYNLASLHKKRRETEKARQLFLECEQTYSAVYGPDHSETQDAARQASLCV